MHMLYATINPTFHMGFMYPQILVHENKSTLDTEVDNFNTERNFNKLTMKLIIH